VGSQTSIFLDGSTTPSMGKDRVLGRGKRTQLERDIRSHNRSIEIVSPPTSPPQSFSIKTL
jgi:hypothetical protein